MNFIKNHGPFRVQRNKNNKEGRNFLCISLKEYGDMPCGWEWGKDNSDQDPLFCIRLFHLNVFYFKKYKTGFELWLMGFWWIK